MVKYILLKNWCFLEKTLESPLDCKEIQPVHPKRNQSWIFIGRTDAEAETALFWPPDVKNWLIRKDPDAGKYWRQEEKGMSGDEMAGWHHQLNGHEFEQTLEVGNGQGGLACCSPWGCKESVAWLSNWTELKILTKSVAKWLYQFIVPLLVCKNFYCSTSSPTLGIFCFNFNHSGGYIQVFHYHLNLSSMSKQFLV